MVTSNNDHPAILYALCDQPPLHFSPVGVPLGATRSPSMQIINIYPKTWLKSNIKFRKNVCGASSTPFQWNTQCSSTRLNQRDSGLTAVQVDTSRADISSWVRGAVTVCVLIKTKGSRGANRHLCPSVCMTLVTSSYMFTFCCKVCSLSWICTIFSVMCWWLLQNCFVKCPCCMLFNCCGWLQKTVIQVDNNLCLQLPGLLHQFLCFEAKKSGMGNLFGGWALGVGEKIDSVTNQNSWNKQSLNLQTEDESMHKTFRCRV